MLSAQGSMKVRKHESWKGERMTVESLNFFGGSSLPCDAP